MARPKNLEQPRANALNEKFDRERSFSFLENLYLPEIFKALWYTLKQIFQPTVTLQYPEEKWDPPAIFRGRPVLVEDNGKERCVDYVLVPARHSPSACRLTKIPMIPKNGIPISLKSTCCDASPADTVRKCVPKKPLL